MLFGSAFNLLHSTTVSEQGGVLLQQTNMTDSTFIETSEWYRIEREKELRQECSKIYTDSDCIYFNSNKMLSILGMICLNMVCWACRVLTWHQIRLKVTAPAELIHFLWIIFYLMYFKSCKQLTGYIRWMFRSNYKYLK